MNWNIIDQPAAHDWIRALCLTLMHSLWQGLFAAIVASGILLCTKKSKPAFRYNMLALVMLVFVSGTVLTLNIMLREIREVSRLVINSSNNWVLQNAFAHTGQAAGTALQTSLITQVMSFFTEHAQVIVAGGLLIFSIKSILAISGLLYLRKVAGQVSMPEMKWTVRFYELAERMRIGQEVELRESLQVAVPMVIGFIRPVVLVPLGMLANLPAAQVEAILLHELAHIRRRDYLINLVQVFCENVFFFNPAIWWISKLIREEREHCCDDLAISVMQNKTSFIHALVSFQEFNQSRPVFEMAFSKKRNHLLDRIKRIVNNNNKPLDAMEKLFVTFSLAAAIALSAATAPEKPATTGKKPVKSAIKPFIILNGRGTNISTLPKSVATPTPEELLPALTDTLPKKKGRGNDIEIHSANVYTPREGVSTYNVTRNNVQYEIVQRNGRIISLLVDDKEIAEGDYAKYQPEIDKIMEEVKAQHELAEKHRAAAEVHRKEAEKHREEAQAIRLEAEKHRAHAEDMRREAEAQRAEAAGHRAEAEVYRKKAEEMRQQAEKDRAAFEKIQALLIEDLSTAGVVKDKEKLSYKLSDDELIINGVKQSAELHQKMKAKYLAPGKKSEMSYNFEGRSGYSTQVRE